MESGEKTCLLNDSIKKQRANDKNKLSDFYATLCIVDVFGVFPIITLPYAIIQCGWYGIPITLIVTSMQIYTAHLLGKCWQIAENLQPSAILTQNRCPYATLANLTLGRRTSSFIAFLLDITIFAGVLPNIIVASQNLQIFGLKITQYDFNFSFCYWMMILGAFLCPIMWLGSPKDMKPVFVISVCIVIAAAVMTWICIIFDNRTTPMKPSDSFDSDENVSFWQQALSTYGIIVFQFDIHPILLTIQVDMKTKSNITKAVVRAFLISAIMFTVTTILTVVRYGSDIRNNLLQSLPAGIPLYITVLLITLQLCLTCVLCNSALYQDIEDYLNIPSHFNYKRCISRTLILIFSILLAESVPRFDIVMHLVGGTFTAPLMFILPSIMYVRMIIMEKRHPRQTNSHNEHVNKFELENKTGERTGNEKMKISYIFSYMSIDIIITVIVLLFGIIATIFSTYFSVRNAIQYASFKPPCLLNITAASRRISS